MLLQNEKNVCHLFCSREHWLTWQFYYIDETDLFPGLFLIDLFKKCSFFSLPSWLLLKITVLLNSGSFCSKGSLGCFSRFLHELDRSAIYVNRGSMCLSTLWRSWAFAWRINQVALSRSLFLQGNKLTFIPLKIQFLVSYLTVNQHSWITRSRGFESLHSILVFLQEQTYTCNKNHIFLYFSTINRKFLSKVMVGLINK